MGVVRLFMSMSLAGFIADPEGASSSLCPDIGTKAAAGRKDVQVVGGADAAQQLIKAGLLDQIQISLMPVLLGEGLRLFEHLGSAPRRLEKIKVVDSPVRTDIRYRVVR